MRGQRADVSWVGDRRWGIASAYLHMYASHQHTKDFLLSDVGTRFFSTCHIDSALSEYSMADYIEQRKKERVEYCEKMLVQREQIRAALSTHLEHATEAVKTARADLISAVERMDCATTIVG